MLHPLGLSLQISILFYTFQYDFEKIKCKNQGMRLAHTLIFIPNILSQSTLPLQPRTFIILCFTSSFIFSRPNLRY